MYMVDSEIESLLLKDGSETCLKVLALLRKAHVRQLDPYARCATDDTLLDTDLRSDRIGETDETTATIIDDIPADMSTMLTERPSVATNISRWTVDKLSALEEENEKLRDALHTISKVVQGAGISSQPGRMSRRSDDATQKSILRQRGASFSSASSWQRCSSDEDADQHLVPARKSLPERPVAATEFPHRTRSSVSLAAELLKSMHSESTLRSRRPSNVRASASVNLSLVGLRKRHPSLRRGPSDSSLTARLEFSSGQSSRPTSKGCSRSRPSVVKFSTLARDDESQKSKSISPNSKTESAATLARLSEEKNNQSLASMSRPSVTLITNPYMHVMDASVEELSTEVAYLRNKLMKAQVPSSGSGCTKERLFSDTTYDSESDELSRLRSEVVELRDQFRRFELDSASSDSNSSN